MRLAFKSHLVLAKVNIMEQSDLLYSGLMLTALILSVWTGALLAAACVFFVPSLLGTGTGNSLTRKS